MWERKITLCNEDRMGRELRIKVRVRMVQGKGVISCRAYRHEYPSNPVVCVGSLPNTPRYTIQTALLALTPSPRNNTWEWKDVHHNLFGRWVSPTPCIVNIFYLHEFIDVSHFQGKISWLKVRVRELRQTHDRVYEVLNSPGEALVAGTGGKWAPCGVVLSCCCRLTPVTHPKPGDFCCSFHLCSTWSEE